MPLEVCVSHIEDAVKAQTAGAGRIELCARLDQGGTTPEMHQIEDAHRLLKIPFRVMIRCRPGNFVFSPEEISLMEEQTFQARQRGADGIVFGALKDDGSIDSATLFKIVKAAFPLPVTFHRAFDECFNPFASLNAIIGCGCSTLLTSGLQPFAWQGLPLIKELQQQFGDKIEIMPGSGITNRNAEEIIRQTGVQWIHASARVPSENGYRMSESMIKDLCLVLKKL
jgi:copper homeostasis protein